MESSKLAIKWNIFELFSTFDEKLTILIIIIDIPKKEVPISTKVFASEKRNAPIVTKQNVIKKNIIIFFMLICDLFSGLIPKKARCFFNSTKISIVKISTVKF